MTSTLSAFALPDTRSAKADPTLIGEDERHFEAINGSLERTIAELSRQLDETRRAPGISGQAALDRDLEVHRLTARLRAMRRYRLDLCLGRIVFESGETVYIGRFGLTAADGGRLLVDWRTPAAEPFFAATLAHPMGLATRRRYRWAKGRVDDYWDEAFTDAERENAATLDDESAFIASLGASRSPQMRDVLGTIQADQDAIIRASSRGALVVDGGPGTGKTVVALHRAAYLLYSEPRLERGGGLLFVGPHEPYLAYVADVLPSLGEESVHTCTLRDLVEEGTDAVAEPNPEVARIKSSAEFVTAVEAAVTHYERPPTELVTVETPWGEVRVGRRDWAEAFGAAEAGMTHNEARGRVWEALVEILVDSVDEEEASPQLMKRVLAADDSLLEALRSSWPLLDPAGVVADLLSVEAFLRECAPWLSDAEIAAVQRKDARAWTTSDIPLLDAARQRIGDPGEARRRRVRAAAASAAREQMDRVVDDLIAADDSELMLMRMLRGQDVQNSLVDEAALPGISPDLLAGPFAHIVIDEAQELSDAEWQMLLRRCPSRSFTIVGDRAQARHGFIETWEERLKRVGLGQVMVAPLSVNYRTPSEVMEVAEPVIRAAISDANVPVSIRSSGLAVRRGAASELQTLLDDWLAANPEGIACVIGADSAERARVRALTPTLAKGLEFDLVVLVDPQNFGEGIEGAVDRYVAMTRTTSQLVILTTQRLEQR